MFRQLRNDWSKKLSRFSHRFSQPVAVGGAILSVVTFICGVAVMVCLAVYAGYDRSNIDSRLIRATLRLAQAVFTANVVFNLMFNRGRLFKGARVLSWIISLAVLSTLLPWAYPRPVHPWIPVLEQILYSNYFLFGVLALYAVVDISYSVMAILGKRTNPSLILSGSFIVFIIIGSLLLMLPRCSYTGIDYIDALFLSTSAICITGLTPVDISLSLTPFGVVILGLLIQIGALGVMTFTSFFAIFFTGSTSIYSQLLLRDVIYSKSMSALIPTLLYVLGFTLATELIGAVMIFVTFHGTTAMTIGEEIEMAVFHAVSAFCNAGFSTIHKGLSNPAMLYGNQAVYWVFSAIIVAGAIGFPILVNFRDALAGMFRRTVDRMLSRPTGPRPVHIYSMNTKIVLTTFFLLFALGAVAFFILEYDNTLRGMTLWQKITQSVFNSVTPRSAGFSSVDPASFLSPTLVMVMMLMWVGGGSQSTAGGVKVNTLAAICLNLRAIVTGRERVSAFGRTVALWSIRRANAVVAISILSYTLFSLVVLMLEPGLPTKDLLFETLSALFTVGSSLGITGRLSVATKLVLCMAMFLGRVGLISMLAGLAGRRSSAEPHYPSDNIIIS